MDPIALLLWIALCLGIAVPGRRLGAWLLPEYPHRGAAFALPIGLVVVAVPTYWVGQLSLAAGMAAGFGLLVLLGLWAGPVASSDADRRDWVIPLAVFAVAFLLLLGFRAARPGIVPVGGEKFLDYSLVRALLRAEALPPEDPWFAGRSLRYYYGGPLIVAILTEVSTVPARIAYNLALPTFYAAIATAAYGLAAAMAEAVDRPPVAGGLIGALLTAFAGPLSTTARASLGLLPRDVAMEYGHPLVAGIRAEYPDAIEAARFLAEDPLRGFSAWNARHVIPDTPNVFPMWTYVNGDLRPHMLDPPFLLLIVALLSAVYASTDRRRRLLVLLLVIPAVGGLVTVINTWSLPVVAGLVVLTLATSQAPPRDLLPAWLRARLPTDPGRSVAAASRLGIASGSGIVVGLLTAVWAAPFLLMPSPANEGIGLFPPRSPIEPFLLFHGGFLLLFGLAFLPAVVRRVGRWRAVLAGLASIGLVWSFPVPDVGATVLAIGLVVAGWALARWDGSVGFSAVLIVAGAGLLVVSELVYAKVYPFDPTAPRWNTIYKLYMHVWLLWGPAGGVAAITVLGRARDALGGEWSSRSTQLRGGVALVLVVGVLLSASTFGLFGTALALGPLAEDPDSIHLDGTAYVERAHPQEAPIIEWVDERDGTPTIVSTPGRDTYSWTNPLSSLTGVPTVVGWEHQIGYRGTASFRDRARDVTTIYETTEPESRAILLKKYEVDYVYVGPRERTTYGVRAETLLRSDAFSVAVRTDNATLVAVNRSRLP